MPKFYECGICGAWHNLAWCGDCREDNERFFPEDMDAKYGWNGWEEVPMPGADEVVHYSYIKKVEHSYPFHGAGKLEGSSHG
jgi:hypothetical protein